MRAAKRVGPRQAVSREGFVTAVRPLRTVTASIELTENETCTSSRSPGIGVRGDLRSRALSGQDSLRAKIANSSRCSDFRAAMQAR